MRDTNAARNILVRRYARLVARVPSAYGERDVKVFSFDPAWCYERVPRKALVQGLMTPMDMLEAITGELQTGTTQDAWATRRDDGSWLIDGLMPVSELKARLDIKELPEEDRGRYNTVAGLLQSVSGHLPSTGERIACAGWHFEIVDLDGKRIDKVLVAEKNN